MWNLPLQAEFTFTLKLFYKFFYGRALSGSNPLVYMHKTKQAPIGRLPCFGAVKGIRTPMVSHTDLNRARLPIPP